MSKDKIIYYKMKIRLFAFITICICLISCKNQDDKYADELVGTWDVYASQMNSRPNGFMKDAYMVFNNDKTVVSNIFEQNTPLPYRVEKNKLIIESDIPFELNIGNLSNDSLYLEGNMSHYYMEYYMNKRK